MLRPDRGVVRWGSRPRAVPQRCWPVQSPYRYWLASCKRRGPQVEVRRHWCFFTSTSNHLHLGPPPRPHLKMQGGWQVNRQSQRCSHCLNQSLRRPQTLLRESSLFDLALLGANNRKYNVCGSAPSKPQTRKLNRLWALTHLHVINSFVHA